VCALYSAGCFGAPVAIFAGQFSGCSSAKGVWFIVPLPMELKMGAPVLTSSIQIELLRSSGWASFLRGPMGPEKIF
jgi:hypothetical protein